MMHLRSFVMLCVFLAFFITPARAQDSLKEQRSTLIKTNNTFLDYVDINLLLRSSLDIPLGGDAPPAAIRMKEMRFEVRGDLPTIPLAYRLRFRLNRTSEQRAFDNAPGAIDIALVDYQFGKRKNWVVSVGKQAAYVGSWEFENNPTYEYEYSEFVNNQLNLFAMGIRLGYQISPTQTVHLQVQNTFNESFDRLYELSGYNKTGRTASKLPLGLILAWQGKFFGDKLQTFYSGNLSQVAKNEVNQSLVLGHKWNLKSFTGYLDLHTSNFGVDYVNIASPSINNYRNNPVRTYASDINYKAAILRLNYEFVPRFFLTAKFFFETASDRKDNTIGKNFRDNIGLLGGLEFQPIKSQNMRMFGYFFNNQKKYHGVVGAANPDISSNMVSLGFFYFVNVL
ncbi:porin [Chitinophaga nivalis]|uniref:Porin n=1 Tax=Chitinophaga nivalis TaxID=2991709 RepID=A0ABT3IEV6_9BACT|nr:porin [Chitinophaga nivalis]MCW3467821.1 porin [Chitinophaga nivalis]MCW3482487.1 porin [Chitinophaga nivalis]